jgi:hypothetical protein
MWGGSREKKWWVFILLENTRIGYTNKKHVPSMERTALKNKIWQNQGECISRIPSESDVACWHHFLCTSNVHVQVRSTPVLGVAYGRAVHVQYGTTDSPGGILNIANDIMFLKRTFSFPKPKIPQIWYSQPRTRARPIRTLDVVPILTCRGFGKQKP